MSEVQKDLLKSPPEKVVLMYQAVMKMLNENCDINSIKVSDITTRAGIGKGTAYEYFSTKEEIITKALIYELMKTIKRINDFATADLSFEKKIRCCFDFISNNFHENRSFVQVVKIALGSYDIADSLKKEFNKGEGRDTCYQLESMEDAILESGVREGVITEQNIFKRRMALNSQIVGFAMYLMAEEMHRETELTIEEVKQYSYENVIKTLS